MTKRDAARGTPEYGRRDKQVQKFSNAAVKKRREGEEGTGRSVIKPFTKEEYISELSPGTLGSYIQKARDSISSDLMPTHNRYAKLKTGGDLDKVRIKNIDKIHKRETGIGRAINKLVKKAETGKPENKKNVIRGASPDATQSFSQK